MMEVWKPVTDTTGEYEVSNFGRVRNANTKSVLVPVRAGRGYQKVKLPSSDGKRDRYIHRLVADAFCIRCVGCNIVNHIDNDITNNSATNLEWTTQRGNVYHAIHQGRMTATSVVGTKDGISHFFPSIKTAEKETGCDHKSIKRSCEMNRETKSVYLWKVVCV